MKKLLGLLCIAAFLSFTPTAKAQTTATIIDSGNVLKITLDGVVQMVQKNNLLLKIDGPYLQIRSTAGDYLQNIKITSISTPSHATNAALLGTIKGYLNTVQSQTVTVSDTVFRNGHNNIHIGNFPASPSTSTLQTTGNTSLSNLEAKIGEVQASPTSNTVLDRLKQIYTALTGTLTVGTHAVSQSGAWTVTSTPSGTQTVAGTVSIANTNFYVSGYTGVPISTLTTTTVATGAGVLGNIVICQIGTGGSTITVYDNTSGSGTVIAPAFTQTQPTTLTFNQTFTTGITVVTSGGVAPKIVVTYKQ